jgi:hypothetical protein
MRPDSRALSLFLVLTLAAACKSETQPGNTGGSGGSSTGGRGGSSGAGGGGGTGGGGSGGTGGAARLDARPADGPRVDMAVVPPKCGPFADGGSPGDTGAPASPTTSFFVTSQKNMTGNLGGLTGADTICQTLAAAAGLGSKTWRAYLSVERDPTNSNMPRHAKDRIGTGPWFNAKGVMVAANLAGLHMRTGDAALFIDEKGNLINGQWTGSPTPNEHDILTGSNGDGTVAIGKTCSDWTSAAGVPDGGVPDAGGDGGGSLYVARVGHSDGYGGMCNTATSPNNLPSWNSAHDNAGCNNTTPRGGAGRFYCFATN